MAKKKIYFATNNKGKFSEAERVLKTYGLNIQQLNHEHTESRLDSCEEIAKTAAREIYEKHKVPLIVEDSGLFIESLKGFPGVYSAYVFGKLGNEGILKLMKGEKNRNAYFTASVSFAHSRGIEAFTAKTSGEIAKKERGKSGFGYDPIFMPKNHEKTFAEDAELKYRVSHRVKAMKMFAKYLVLQYKR